MTELAPILRIPVGVVVERRRSMSRWADFIWRPTAVLAGLPDAVSGTVLAIEDETTTFYAGAAEIALYRTETDKYHENLVSGAPSVWVAIQVIGGDPPYTISAVTVDPAEGESYSEAGTAVIEAVPMPETLRATVAEFVAEYPVERAFEKRKRDRSDPEALARRGIRWGSDHER